MTSLQFRDSRIELESGETVLDGLLRHGHRIPYGCRGGACQSCLLQATSGTVPAQAQLGLKETQKSQGFLLSCMCVPDSPLSLHLPDLKSERRLATVTAKDRLTDSVVRLRVACDLDYRAGQYITLWADEALSRTYSLASVPNLDSELELHIKRIEGGALSPRIYDTLDIGARLWVQGPMGSCFYTEGVPEGSLLLLGIGTGLAPLYGILRDALQCGHCGPIQLVVGSRRAEQFYLVEQLQMLEARNPQLSIRFCALEGSHRTLRDTPLVGDIPNWVKQHCADLRNTRVYICGADSFVQRMKKQCFLQGASMRDIHADSFLPFRN